MQNAINFLKSHITILEDARDENDKVSAKYFEMAKELASKATDNSLKLVELRTAIEILEAQF